jgi:hypothetical protein
VKFALAIVVTASLCGCSQDAAQQSPTSPATLQPAPPPASLTWLFGYVVDGGGLCIEGATVEVAAGQSIGQRTTQLTPCDEWAYGNGFEFYNLTPGIAITLRASAPGWSTCEYSVTPHLGSQSAVVLPLSRPGAACPGPST